MLSGQSDLAFTMSYEALPDFKVTDLAALKLEREVADVADEAVDKALGEPGRARIRYEVEADRGGGRRRPRHHRLRRPDRRGGVRGRQGRGRTTGGRPVPVHPRLRRGHRRRQGRRGARRQRQVPGRLPEKKLAGKDAVFAVKVKEVAKPIGPELNDEFAKTLGAATLAKLRELVAARIARGISAHTRARSSSGRSSTRLDKAHDFALPETLVTNEFDGIWKQLTQNLEQAGKTRGRGQERGGIEGRVPQDGGAAGAPGPRHRRDRREGNKVQVRPGRAAPRADRAGAPLSGAGEVRLRVLREEPERSDRAARADLRGQGGRPYPRQAKPADKKVSVEELLKPEEADGLLQQRCTTMPTSMITSMATPS